MGQPDPKDAMGSDQTRGEELFQLDARAGLVYLALDRLHDATDHSINEECNSTRYLAKKFGTFGMFLNIKRESFIYHYSDAH